MRALLLLIVLVASTTPVSAEELQVIGYSGYLGEWELTAAVTEIASQPQQYAGAMTMKHVGLCTQGGPEEKTGEIRFHISGPKLDAVLTVAGVPCTYSGRLSDAFDGTLSCADREAVPLKLWVR